jgi:Uma2 family endonuclease
VSFNQGRAENELAIEEPPLLCAGILAPSDRLSDTVKKCPEYLRWGVPSCWILNLETQEAWTMNMTGIDLVASDGVLRAGEITVAMPEVFQAAH